MSSSVELTEAEKAPLYEYAYRICTCHQGDACLRREPFWQAVERIIDARLAPIRALADEWGIDLTASTGNAIHDGGDFAEAISDSGAWRFVRDLRAALSAPLTAPDATDELQGHRDADEGHVSQYAAHPGQCCPDGWCVEDYGIHNRPTQESALRDALTAGPKGTR